MNDHEAKIIERFRALVNEHLTVQQMIVFGSRARGDADVDSDLDILVVVEEPVTKEIRKIISDCAWEADCDSGILLAPVVISRLEWEQGLERFSLLGLAIQREGVPV